MSSHVTTPEFDSPALPDFLGRASEAELDSLGFGIIGFDSNGHVRRYNREEARWAKFEQASTKGQHVFVELAPCMNNFMVATRFEEARTGGQSLDALLPYVLTFRMRPTRVRLRLLWQPGSELAYIAVERTSGVSA